MNPGHLTGFSIDITASIANIVIFTSINWKNKIFTSTMPNHALSPKLVKTRFLVIRTIYHQENRTEKATLTRVWSSKLPFLLFFIFPQFLIGIIPLCWFKTWTGRFTCRRQRGTSTSLSLIPSRYWRGRASTTPWTWWTTFAASWCNRTAFSSAIRWRIWRTAPISSASSAIPVPYRGRRISPPVGGRTRQVSGHILSP